VSSPALRHRSGNSKTRSRSDELAAFKVEPVGFPSFPATGDPFDSLVKKLDCGRE